MKKRSTPVTLLFIGWCVTLFSFPMRTAAQSTELSISSTNSGLLVLEIANAPTGSTYYVEESAQLSTNSAWQTVYAFEGTAGYASWSPSSTNETGFYRVLSAPYRAGVGRSALLQTRYHGVSGTAHIVNNRTIELRNFNFDGGGLDVKVIVSPSPYPSFSPYTIISDDLVGPAFVNATLVLDLPEGLDPNVFSYISIWCVDVSISFGDGMFE